MKVSDSVSSIMGTVKELKEEAKRMKMQLRGKTVGEIKTYQDAVGDSNEACRRFVLLRHASRPEA